VFNACAASVVEIVLSISLFIVPLDCERWAAGEALPGRLRNESAALRSTGIHNYRRQQLEAA
jgi:hypothetical protein